MRVSDQGRGASGNGHEHQHEHEHEHGHGIRACVRRLAGFHSHGPAGGVDRALAASAAGMRALWVSLAILAVTAMLQAVVVVASGSVALLGDTVHNAADALTAVPLGMAFLLARRPPNQRYTYGYGRAEDLAGVAIVLVIAASAALAVYQAVERLIHPQSVSYLGAVAAAAAIGFAGNEFAARCRIRTGRAIGSAALVADGLHARADGLTSLAVLAAAGGAALGWRQADPVAGLIIALAIAGTAWQAARGVWQRLMDAVDPALVARATATLRATPGVLGTGQVRLRWTGHQLRGECEITVDSGATAVQAHQIAAEAEHALLHALPGLTAATVHADPGPAPGIDHHGSLAAHR